MKKTRKLLSILLALIMALSLCTVAFAADEEPGEPAEPEIVYNWAPIPTSAEGLEKGAYYLDFNDLLDFFCQYMMEDLSGYYPEGTDPENPTPEQIAAAEAAIKALIIEYQIQPLTDGQWFFDEEKCAFKGIVSAAARPQAEGVGDNEEEPKEEIGPDEVFEYFYMAFSVGKSLLHQVGENFVPVKMSAEGLQDGDYYLDIDAAVAAYIAAYKAYLEANKPVREDYETDEDYAAALAEYQEELDFVNSPDALAEAKDEMFGQFAALSSNLEPSTLLKLIVTIKYMADDYDKPIIDPETGDNVLDEYGSPTYEQKEETQTLPVPFYFNFISQMVGEGDSYYDALYEAFTAGIKQYKEEKPEEPTTDKPDEKPADDKDEDGGYSNNAFMKFIKKIIQAIKDFFNKIFKK